MAQFLVDQLTSLGAFNVEKRPVGTHKLEGKEVDLPPVVIGQVGNDPNKVSPSSYLPLSQTVNGLETSTERRLVSSGDRRLAMAMALMLLAHQLVLRLFRHRPLCISFVPPDCVLITPS
jgi:Cys-Gly metallodipeptidase DUG1